MSIERIVSGGQTGVDRAALDLALELGINAGGWAPKGRMAEDGPLPERYRMTETPSDDPAQRTEWNVRDSEATLIISDGELNGGSALTAELAARLRRPRFHADLSKKTMTELIDEIGAWLAANHFRVLNIAGPRLSKDPDIYDKARRVLRTVFTEVKVVR
jgi:predicted Rossmann fold nucleotide-binding protein DprA/Smf involved in DNA uptake